MKGEAKRPVKRRWMLAGLAASVSSLAGAAPKPAPVKKAPAKPAPTPAPAPPAPEPGITAVNLAPTLRALGYAPAAVEGYLRLQVEDEFLKYPMDLKVTGTGDWLVVMAYLAEVPDLTKVRSAPLLALLGRNDDLLGMAFSYNAARGQIMLSAAVPARTLTPSVLRVIIEGLRITVKQTAGLWDTSHW